jgi:hypothetical protein
VLEDREFGWLIKGLQVPDPNDTTFTGTAYTWWQRGATDEHYLEIEGLDPEVIELLEVVKALGRARPDMAAFALAGEIARIYGWEIRDAAADEVPATPTPGETPKTAQHGDFGCCASSETESTPPVTTAEGH